MFYVVDFKFDPNFAIRGLHYGKERKMKLQVHTEIY